MSETATQAAIDEANERALGLIPDRQLYLDTNPYADDDSLLVPVTLFVGGLVISGRPVTFETWFSRFRRHAPEREEVTLGSAVLRKTAATRKAELKAVEDLPEDHEFTDEEKLTYVSTVSASMFLIDAVVASGSTSVLGDGQKVDMKVRYASVDAWSYGQLTFGGPAS